MDQDFDWPVVQIQQSYWLSKNALPLIDLVQKFALRNGSQFMFYVVET